MSHSLAQLLDLKAAPVALSFRDAAPDGVEHVASPAPAGCSYWSMAANGSTFYTEASDHFGCPVGAHTHGVELPPETAAELQGLVQVMVGLEYLTMEEIPQIPTRRQPLRTVTYAPLSESSEPDVVLVRGNARQLMLLTEAANAAGVGPDSAAMGRPACSVVPSTLNSGRATTSLGCIGNRVYTGLADEEFYLALPGAALSAVLEKLATILHANQELEKFHQARRG